MISICVFIFYLISKSGSQTPVQTIRGTITDTDSKSPLIAARVILMTASPEKGSLTDEEGKFIFSNIPVGRHTIRITYLGYVNKELNQLNLTSGKELVLNIEMNEALIESQTVTITSEQDKTQPVNELALVSARAFSVEETQRYAASLNDPGRMASAFAGVQPSSDGRNNIIIRGNSPAGMLWRLEGVDIPNPNHFASPGSSGGGISILSNYLLANSDFMTGAFPAEYGNATSGVFDLHLRKGNNQKREYAFQAGFLGINAAVEGPFSKKNNASYLANYRYSTLGLMTLFGLPIVQGAVFSYQDLNFHLSFPTHKAGIFSFWGMGGLSSQTEKAKRDTSSWQVPSDRHDNKYGSNMGASGITHTFLLNDGKTYFRSSLSVSANEVFSLEDTLNNSFKPSTLSREGFLTGRFVATTAINHKFNARHLLRAGAFFNFLFYKLQSAELNKQSGLLQDLISATGGSVLIQPYAQYRWRVSEKFTFNAGLHSMYFDLNKTWSLEPRASMRWGFSKKQALSFGYGLHSQILPLGTYFSEIRLPDGTAVKPNLRLDMIRAHHFVAGHEIQFSSDLRLKTELYYQRLFNIPIGMESHPTLSVVNTDWGFEIDSLVNKGLGNNYGAEFTFEKFFSKNYYFLLTTSLYESKYRAADGIWRDTRYNGNYAFNFLGGKEIYFGKNKKHYFEMSGRIVWQGGQRWTPIDLSASILADRTVYNETLAFQLRKKDYFRTDIRVAWHYNGIKASHTLSFDVQNLFNSKNDFVQDYDSDTQTIKQYYQAGFVPIMAYRVDW